MNLTGFLCKMMSFLGAIKPNSGNWNDIVGPLRNILDAMLLPIIIGVGVAGAIYGIVLGVQYSRAEGDQKENVKKKLINAVIGFVIALIILIIMRLFTKNVDAIQTWIQDVSKKK